MNALCPTAWFSKKLPSLLCASTSDVTRPHVRKLRYAFCSARFSVFPAARKHAKACTTKRPSDFCQGSWQQLVAATIGIHITDRL